MCGDASVDACGICDGGETDPGNCIQEGFSVSFGNVDYANGVLDIVMNNVETSVCIPWTMLLPALRDVCLSDEVPIRAFTVCKVRWRVNQI